MKEDFPIASDVISSGGGDSALIGKLLQTIKDQKSVSDLQKEMKVPENNQQVTEQVTGQIDNDAIERTANTTLDISGYVKINC